MGPKSIVASVSIHGTAHGYDVVAELVQDADGRRWFRSWGGPTEPPRFERSKLDVDFEALLETLEREPAPSLDDPTRGPVTHLTVSVGERRCTFAFQRPLIGSERTDRVFDDVYEMMWGWP